ncbi:MAG: hypothetical protein EU536_03025 [Promethearchaeota archaeon]|nr:MAG: hypothetical protein EU536_03025 [Candidatus Lokiarchaeota archaeon]
MNTTDYYEIVRQKLILGPLSAPKHPKVIELLKVFWNEDEIKLLSHFPTADKFIPLNELVEKSGISKAEVKKMLNRMHEKRVICKSGSKYGLLPLAPGIFEAYFSARRDSADNLKKAAKLMDYFLKNILSFRFIDHNFSFLRPLLPIEAKQKFIQLDESVEYASQVLPYELVERLINEHNKFAVIPCQCRLVAELNGEPCSLAKAEDGCFIAGIGAQYIADTGMGRLLNKQEAIEYLKKTEKAGLVHNTTYCSGLESSMFICNCCPCHCGVLGPTRQFGLPLTKKSNFEPVIDNDLCVKCETCVKKCPMDAIYHQFPLHPDSSDDKIIVRTEICIGCGLCASNCAKNAIVMKKVRNDIPPKELKLGNKTFTELIIS